MDRKLLEKLEAELDAARKRREAARKRFDEIIRDVPSGIPEPDGSLRRKQASDEYRQAIREVTEALVRFNRLILFDEVPDDESYKKSSGA